MSITHFHQYMIPVPAMETPREIPQGVKFWNQRPERYAHDDKNLHHWTSNYVWNTVIPILASDYNFTVNVSDYVLTPRTTSVGDFSFHTFRKTSNIVFTDMENNIKMTGDNTVLRYIDPCMKHKDDMTPVRLSSLGISASSAR